VNSNGPDTFVTESLAAGLARQAIREWRDRVERTQPRLMELARRKFSTSKGVARTARELNNLLAPLAFHSVVHEFKRAGTYQASFLPKLRDIDGIEHLAVVLRVFAVNLDGLQLCRERPLAFIHPHALARMFLRMQTTALADVRKQIGSSLRFYPPIADACAVLRLQQIVIPTAQGYFRCDVRLDSSEFPGLLAKTWIGEKTMGHRDLGVLESIVNAAAEWNGHATHDELSRMSVPMKAPETLVAQMADALRTHAWLTEPYEERPDYLSAIWEAARRQAG